MLKLYTVATGVNNNHSEPTQQVEDTPLSNSEPKLILDNKKYQNNKFDLSQDGKTIVVQRLNRKNPQDFGLWIINKDNSIKSLIG